MIKQDTEERKAHYHVALTDIDFVFNRYQMMEDDKGEAKLEPNHYHGFYVDYKTAKEVVYAVKAQQHGAEQ